MANYQHSYSVEELRAANFQPSTWHVHRDKMFGQFSDANEKDEDQIAAINPVYVIPYHAISSMQHWFSKDQTLFE